MKFIRIILCSLLFTLNGYSQDSGDIAKVYFKKAQASFKANDFAKASNYLDKTIKYYNGITRTEVAIFGTKLYVQKKEYASAQKYAKQYFVLAKNKSSKKYKEMLLLYVNIRDVVAGDSKTVTIAPETVKDTVTKTITQIKSLPKKDSIPTAKDTLAVVLKKDHIKIAKDTVTLTFKKYLQNRCLRQKYRLVFHKLLYGSL